MYGHEHARAHTQKHTCTSFLCPDIDPSGYLNFCNQALSDGGQLIIAEQIISEFGDTSPQTISAKNMDIMMMVSTMRGERWKEGVDEIEKGTREKERIPLGRREGMKKEEGKECRKEYFKDCRRKIAGFSTVRFFISVRRGSVRLREKRNEARLADEKEGKGRREGIQEGTIQRLKLKNSSVLYGAVFRIGSVRRTAP